MNRDFKGIWIPREIWLAKDLSCQEKCLWAEIHSLYDREAGGCYASNEYLCKFLDIKERRLQEMMSNLKHKGWVIQVSFDGRTRIIKAIIPPEDFKPDDNGAGQRCGKVHPRGAEKCTSNMQDPAPPSYIRDTSKDTRLDTPPIPPQNSPMSAKADEKSENIFPQSKSKAKQNFSPQIVEITEKILDALKNAKPDFVRPKNLVPLKRQVEGMIHEDKRDPEKILKILAWALADPFWKPHMYQQNPAHYLRIKFDRLDEKMKYVPLKNARKFAPSSNDAEALRALTEWEEKYAI